jgi:hypothetical protein
MSIGPNSVGCRTLNRQTGAHMPLENTPDWWNFELE